jgi:negative regulator of replication initiation
MEDLTTALEITIVGMGLVFGAIVLLWLTMLLLMRFTSEKAAADAAERERKRRAAIAAVAVALAREAQQTKPQAFPLPPTAVVSAWQSVQRGRLLAQKGPQRGPTKR